MEIVMIGSGNVATHLSRAFYAADHKVKQVWSRSANHAQTLASIVNSEVCNDLEGLYKYADFYIVSVVDDAIEEVLSKLHLPPSAIVLHTSGSTNISVLSSLFHEYGVFYPLQTFSKNVDVNIKSTPILLEASSTVVYNKIASLASSISDHVIPCNSKQRIMLHVAAVFACNFTNHLYSISRELLVENQLDFNLLRPLIKETAEKVMTQFPEDVQTGPAVRKDMLTLNRHRDQLSTNIDLLKLYNILSEHILERK